MWVLLLVGLQLLVSTTICSAAFNTATCAAMNQESLDEANKLTESVSDVLVGEGKPFAKAVDGVMVTVVNSTNGDSDGGATNPNGSYMSIYLLTDEGSAFLPKGACDFPACTNGTGTFECHDRCVQTAQGRVSMQYLLGPADALVVTLCTPPEMKYFSYDTYIGTRTTHDPEPFYPGQNFGDSINMLNINLSAKASSEYLQPAAFVQTADGAAAKIISDAYGEAGLDAGSVSVRAIDSDIVRMWDRTQDQTTAPAGGEADFLLSVMRLSVPYAKSTAQFEQYQLASWPVKLYLAADDAQAAEPLHPALTSRFSDAVIDEQATYGKLIDTLEASIKGHWSDKDMSKACTQMLNTTTLGSYDDWTEILHAANNQSFVLPTRDATYGMPFGAFDENGDGCAIAASDKHVGVVFGVLHDETLQLSYSQISMAVLKLGVKKIAETLSFETGAQLKGSARRYLSPEVLEAVAKDGIDADLLYAVDIKGPGACTSAEKSSGICLEWGDYSKATLPPIVILGERMYCSKATSVGPDATQTVASRMMSFGPG